MGSNGTSKSTLLILGGVVGALTGLGIAYMLTQRSEKEGGEIRLSTGEGVRLGLLVLGLLRQVGELGEKSES
jgi:high-affinity Fe2+/Pb2+ permease